MQFADMIIINANIINPNQETADLQLSSFAINEGVIQKIGGRKDILKNYTSKNILDVTGKYVFPGMINTHSHLFQVLTKGLGKERPLWEWLTSTVFKMVPYIDEEAIYYAALAGCLENIKSGCTTILDFQYCRSRSGHFDAVCQAFADSGIRGYVGRQQYAEPMNDVKKESGDEYFNNIGDIVSRMREPDMLNVAMVAPAIPGLFEDGVYYEGFFENMKCCAAQYRIPYTQHLVETIHDDDYILSRAGMRTVEYLEKQKYFSKYCILAHCVKMAESDFEIFAKYGVKVSHNPVSNMLLASGVCPVTKFKEYGIDVGLATDGAGSNDSQDMLETLKFTSLLQKVFSKNTKKMTAAETFEMATKGGARVLNREDIGMIKEGNKADFFVYNPSVLHSAPVHNPVSSLVYTSSQANIEMVVINGQMLYNHGVLNNIEETAVIEKLEKAAFDIREKANVSRN